MPTWLTQVALVEASYMFQSRRVDAQGIICFKVIDKDLHGLFVLFNVLEEVLYSSLSSSFPGRSQWAPCYFACVAASTGPRALLP